MGRKFAPLPRQVIQVDERGRITIPDYLRKAAGIEPGAWIEIEVAPSLENCKYITIKSR